MCFVPSPLPGSVGTAFVLVPGMTIPMVAVVVSVVRAVFMPIPGLDAPQAQSGSHPAEANLDTNAVAACISS
jgi:hypothetical protein